MLILSRRPQESLVITCGDTEIVVTVLGVKGNQVRLAISAPKEVNVVRTELLEIAPIARNRGNQ